jgi:protein TonB
MQTAEQTQRQLGQIGNKIGRARLQTVVVVVVSAVVLGLLAYGARALINEKSAPRRHQVQQISLVRPPLPPPPPPQVERPKDEVKQEIKEPEPKDDSPPPDAPLGLDAKGTSGGDNFGLAGRPGGREITSLGDKGTGDGRGFIFYANQLQAQLQDELNQQRKLRGSDYRATVAVWIGADGRVQRVDLTGSTGDPDTDKLLRMVIAEARRLKAPPENMPQPVRLRITSRGAG